MARVLYNQYSKDKRARDDSNTVAAVLYDQATKYMMSDIESVISVFNDQGRYDVVEMMQQINKMLETHETIPLSMWMALDRAIGKS